MGIVYIEWNEQAGTLTLNVAGVAAAGDVAALIGRVEDVDEARLPTVAEMVGILDPAAPSGREPGEDDDLTFPPPEPARLASLLPVSRAEAEKAPEPQRGEQAPSARDGEGGGNGEAQECWAGPPADLAPFKLLGSLREVVTLLGKNYGCKTPEDFVRACRDLRASGGCSVLERVPALTERVVRVLGAMGMLAADPDEVERLTDDLLARYERKGAPSAA